MPLFCRPRACTAAVSGTDTENDLPTVRGAASGTNCTAWPTFMPASAGWPSTSTRALPAEANCGTVPRSVTNDAGADEACTAPAVSALTAGASRIMPVNVDQSRRLVVVPSLSGIDRPNT